MRVSSLKNGSCLREALTGGDGTDTSPFLGSLQEPQQPYLQRTKRVGETGKVLQGSTFGTAREDKYVLGHKPMFKLQLSI